MMPSEDLGVGVVGLGAMGASMAANLAKAGLLVAVWNRTALKASTLAGELNVAAAASPAPRQRHAHQYLPHGVGQRRAGQLNCAYPRCGRSEQGHLTRADRRADPAHDRGRTPLADAL